MRLKSNKPFAEIIESSLSGWLAQSWQWDQFPSFASLITTDQKERLLIGIVHQVKTGSMDPMRYPFPYQKTEEELLKEQPQIFEFLKTTFNCLTIGYYEKGRIYYTLAPKPAKIHSFVAPIEQELAKRFLGSCAYLHTLFSMGSQISNLDELLLAILRMQSEQKAISQIKLNQFMQTYSLLTGNDYRRMKLFLQRVNL